MNAKEKYSKGNQMNFFHQAAQTLSLCQVSKEETVSQGYFCVFKFKTANSLKLSVPYSWKVSPPKH